MIREISVEDLDKLRDPVFIDVRSEAEFAEATIPGAFNLPLLNNQERQLIGTIYTQESPSLAREKGLQIVSPKLPDLVQEAGKLAAKNKPLVVFCWRGGMRSKSLTTVLDLMGLSVYRLQGGFKAYRRIIHQYFEEECPFKVFVLRGNTGVGKTEILKQLQGSGYPAVDLEKLANNRGSVFGAIGLGEPPSQKKFEALLYEEMARYSDHPYIIVECESKRIGRVMLPQKFFDAMQAGKQILIYDSVQNRVNRLLEDYAQGEDTKVDIRVALQRLVKNLGHKKVAEYEALLEQGLLADFTENMLEYYDALYAYPNQADAKFDHSISYENREFGLQELMAYLDREKQILPPSAH